MTPLDGRAAYEADVLARPTYPDGGWRKRWEDLSEAVRETWERNPTLRGSVTVCGACGREWSGSFSYLPAHSPCIVGRGDTTT